MRSGHMLRPLIAVFVAAAAAVGWAGGHASAPAAPAIPLEGTGVEGETTLRDADGRIMVANFRLVEPERLYRASSFPVNATLDMPEGRRPAPAAYVGPTFFELLRARNVRQVVTLDEADHAFYAEEGYYRYWTERTGYAIALTHIPVAADDAYGRDDLSGLHAGAMLVSMMRGRAAGQGAVLVHGDAGKDGLGIAVAVYETWRNHAWTDRETLWQQVTARYVLSNRLLRDTGSLLGESVKCPSGQEGYVCPEWLSPLRGDVEFIAKL